MSKKYIISGSILAFIIIVLLILIYFFKISFTSLPTNLPIVLAEELTVNGERRHVESITITQSDSNHLNHDEPVQSENEEEIVLDQSNDITRILIDDVRIYHGGRITSDSPEYTAEMSLSDGDSLYLYLTNEYIRIVPPEQNGKLYKVLDKENAVYAYFHSLFEEEQN
ncbi:hypothetical protein [Oceanobacillus jeddahense]|uniref:Uncharacterized protein n=1 Tax=Oceanobacillus jeddahense TaxID=1462527 RepID=A0ABY5JVH6_9BACI|nr:hypothetical protein [Oceanobacillus jeddahense]UUI02857.1 hypothetical protein NP439_22965 [Oceanobacillus jeddahense]